MVMDFSLTQLNGKETEMKNPIDQIREILEQNDIHVKSNYNDQDNGCTQMKKESGSCKEECPYFRDCMFGAAMGIDYLSYNINPKLFPNGFKAHLLNSIDLFHAGIQVDPKNINIHNQ